VWFFPCSCPGSAMLSVTVHKLTFEQAQEKW
jgi:hypothetical protein